MNVFEEFEQDLRDALTHLYDPIYQPSEVLWAATGCGPEQGVASVQAIIIQAIEDLEPPDAVPPSAGIRRVHKLLDYRYIQGLTQEETAWRLGISVRYLRRQQWKAAHVLANLLWERSRTGKASTGGLKRDRVQPSVEPPPAAAPTEWLLQLRQELDSLWRRAPEALADVGETIGWTVATARSTTTRRDVALEVGPVPANLNAPIHPSPLRQALLAAIQELSHPISSGKITLSAQGAGDQITITVRVCPFAGDSPPDPTLIEAILAAYGGSVQVLSDDGGLLLLMKLRLARSPGDEVSVLVVDDNEDMIEVYRSYTAQTRYTIEHVAEGLRVFEAIAASAPAVIVLDVMLPDIDGWELLLQLHEHHLTRSIPIVVCSVIRDERLALAFGARRYLAKPVRRQQFIGALDQALNRAAAEGPIVPESNATTC